MDKKSCMLMVIVIFIILGGCCLLESNFNSKSHDIKVGEIYFDMPNGFSINESNESSVRIYGDGHSIIISQLIGNDIDRYVDGYILELENLNSTAIISNQTLKGINTIKVESNSTGAIHFWFKYDGKIYSISTWGKFNKMDEITSKLIESMKRNN